MLKSLFNNTILFIALQYLLTRKKQSFLAIAGVLLGVTTFIVMTNFMTGVNDFLDEAVFSGNPDIVISQKATTLKAPVTLNTRFLENTDNIYKTLAINNNVKAYAGQLITPAILISDTQQLSGSINGVIPEQEKKMVNLEKRLLSGKGFKSLTKKNTILLGVSLAKRLKIAVGDSIQIIVPNGKSISLTVSGIFSFGITTIDNIRAYTSAETLQHFLSKSSAITHIHVKLKNRNDVSLEHVLLQNSKAISTENWKDANKTIVIGNKVRNILTWSVSFAILLVAGFGIYNIQNSMVIHKRKDIAVLKTIGYSSIDIVFIFLVQSIIIGLIGSLLGLGLGYIISYLISITGIDTTDFIIVETYPINFEPVYYVLAFSFGILATLFSGYFPSKKASKVDPIKIIRGL